MEQFCVSIVVSSHTVRHSHPQPSAYKLGAIRQEPRAGGPGSRGLPQEMSFCVECARWEPHPPLESRWWPGQQGPGVLAASIFTGCEALAGRSRDSFLRTECHPPSPPHFGLCFSILAIVSTFDVDFFPLMFHFVCMWFSLSSDAKHGRNIACDVGKFRSNNL